MITNKPVPKIIASSMTFIFNNFKSFQKSALPLMERLWRRPTDPNNNTYYESNYGMYHRYTFPISEQDYNFDNWLSATNNQDLFSTKTWLEK